MRAMLVIWAILLAWPARGGMVRMLDGTVHEGQVSLEGGQLSVRMLGGGAVGVELEQVLSARFRSAEPNAAAARWVGRDMGEVKVPGSVRFAGETMTVRGSGADWSGAVEGGYFVHQMLEGDGQIVGRVMAVQQTDRQAKAGLMIRSNAAVGVPYGMMVVQAGGGVRFQSRGRAGAKTPNTDWPAFQTPCWLKLVRRGDKVTGYVSADGEGWELVGSGTVQLPARALVGVLVSARNQAAVCAATLEEVEVVAEREKEPTNGTGGVLLRQGSMVGGQIRAMNESAVRVRREGEVSIPRAEVAQVILAPMNARLAGKLAGGRRGVLLRNGDFVEGEVVGIEGGRVKVSSVLFGLRRFEVGQAVAVVLGETARRPGRYEVRGAEGSVLLVDGVDMAGDGLRVEVPGFGTVRVPAEQVVEIRAGESRFQWLAEMKPIRVEGDAAGFFAKGRSGGTGGGAAPSLGGRECEKAVRLGIGTSAGYDLAGKYRTLTFRAGVPDGVLAAVAVRIVVRADGKEIYRSPDRASVDEPVAVRLEVAGVKVLELGIEGEANGVPGACGVIGEAVLVK